MVKSSGRSLTPLLGLAVMLILLISAGSSASAVSSLHRYSAEESLAEHHKPDHDNGAGNGPPADGDVGKEKNKEKKHVQKRDVFGPASMFQPVPSMLDNFELIADGSALSKRDGRDEPLASAEVVLRASVIREEGNHFRFLATGTVEIDNDEYDIVDAQGIVIFFKNLRGKSVAGLVHIVGKHAVDETGNDLGKFRLRALVMDSADAKTWRIVVFPAGKLGNDILLVNMEGTIGGKTGGSPTPSSPYLHHFLVSSIPSPIAAGSGISVTVTAHMSNGTLLKTYEDKARITDGTGTVRPVITPRFQDGVYKGVLNITKASSADKIRFTDVETGKYGESNVFAVVGGSLTHVTLMPAEVDLMPGAKAQFEAKGTDKFGNELSDLAFGWSLSSQNYGSISTAGNKANFTAGTLVSASVKLDLTAAAGTKSDKSQITISPRSSLTVDHFLLGNISSPQTAGMPFSLTVKAVNSSGAVITGYAGPMRLTDSTGTFNTTVSSGFVNGVWTGTVNITKSDDEVRITASDVASDKKSLSSKFEVTSGSLHHFELSQVGNQTAGTQFNLTVSARDAFGNLLTSYQGNVTLATNDGSSPNGNTTLFSPKSYNFTMTDAGQRSFAVTMYNVNQDVTITATGSGKSGISNEFDLKPAAVTSISISPTSATVNVGGKAIFNAKASDMYGNSIPGLDFQWSLDSDLLGEVEELASSSAEFTASSAISATTSGALHAKVGSITGMATITVET